MTGDSDPTDFFPYRYRGNQEEIVTLIEKAVRDGDSAVIESGTGTGKTVVSMAGALRAVSDTGQKVIYLTRTKSQQRQIIHEAGEISRKRPVTCIGVQGRSVRTCPMMSDDPDNESGTSDELSRLCSEYKKDDGTGRPCIYYENIGKADIQSLLTYVRTVHPEPEEFAEYCLREKICPYETVKHLINYADIVAAPYPFIFMPHIRERFLEWAGVPLSQMVMIVDEAHNLPDYLRDMMTLEYSMKALALVDKEAAEWNDPEIHSGLCVTDVTAVMRECLEEALSRYLTGDDGMIPYTFLQDELMDRLGMSSHSLNILYKSLIDRGDIIAETRKAGKKLPRSHILSLGRFLSGWNMSDEETSIFLIIGGENPKFQAYCLDPRAAAEPLRLCQSSIHMSGTLSPLSDYTAEIGLPNAVERMFPSPFPSENLMTLYVDDVSTKYDEFSNMPEIYFRIKTYIISLIGSVNRNTAVFFPSYALMERFLADGIRDDIRKVIFTERRGMTQSELMEEVSGFRLSEGGVLFAVTGGRISEGLDFPDKDMEMAILVGIPYPKPTAKQEALRRYYDMRFGDGWEHSSKIPAMRKMRQAIGRLIRSDTDRAVAVILDRRTFMLESINAELSRDPCGDVVGFFLTGQR
ncbi:MAG: ATP-dependent DNA helicase [Candidatus Methanoplasma sp.]|jgi:DNA excision repair protein ERCC-2|nr:ATP-dependent DNA helicase [Candidatus Methanoplasma sp.]